MQELRLLQEKDLESIYPIYVYYVKTSTAIFDVVPDWMRAMVLIVQQSRR